MWAFLTVVRTLRGIFVNGFCVDGQMKNSIGYKFWVTDKKLVFPQNFNEELQHFNKAQVQLIADASDPNVANTLINYATTIIMDFKIK